MFEVFGGSPLSHRPSYQNCARELPRRSDITETNTYDRMGQLRHRQSLLERCILLISVNQPAHTIREQHIHFVWLYNGRDFAFAEH